MRIPVACSLEPTAARSQLGEWDELLRRSVAGFERTAPGRLELTLVPDANVGALSELARREVECCQFFTFTLGIQVDRLMLVVEVPDDAVGILDQLVASAHDSD